MRAPVSRRARPDGGQREFASVLLLDVCFGEVGLTFGSGAGLASGLAVCPRNRFELKGNDEQRVMALGTREGALRLLACS